MDNKRIVQALYYEKETKQISENNLVDKTSSLRSLNPFLDAEGILRVGGRLENAQLLNHDQKHPMILPYKSHITELIIRYAHHETLHGGNQLTLSYIRQEFWIPQAKKKVRQIIRQCTICIRFRASASQQQMGALPSPRVTPSQPFKHSGIDYAGPIQLRLSKGRGTKSYKGYIAIFICLCTKAVHIEAVSELTSNAFIAAFRRFTSRRGLCTDLYSDNGTNFVGAQKILDKEFKEAIKKKTLEEAITTERVRWHWVPPASPHFGGLWEAGVKSIKYHLKRVVGNHTLTFEELTTLLCQIEACLNSRPLITLSENPNELDALTPGHFLIGSPLKALPETNETEEKTGLLNRWALVQKMKKDFWKKWTSEYLTRLQHRTKWTDKEENLKIGDIVIIKQETVNPNAWPLGRITQVHPGKDDLVRVVTLRTSNQKEIKRPINKLCKLPTDLEPQSIAETKTRQNFLSPTKKIFLTVLTLIYLTIPSNAEFTFHKLSPGIYVEHIGQAYINAGSLKMTIKFPISQIKADKNNMNATLEKFQLLCKEVEGHSIESHCRDFEDHLAEIQTENNLLIDKILSASRKRRGILGDFMTSVFGVNEEVYRDIDNLRDNQQQLIDTTNHQAKIMVSTLASINRTEQKINKKLEKFREKVNKGIELINGMHSIFKTVDENHIKLQIISNFELANNYLNEIYIKYRKIMDACDQQMRRNEFISPPELIDAIDKVERKIPSDVKVLPEPIWKMEYVKDHENIQILMFLFIVQKMPYDLIKSTPVPIKREDEIFIEPIISTPLLAVEYNSQKYFELSDQQFEMSTQMANKGTHICNPGIIKSMENEPNCVIDKIYNRTEETNCKLSGRRIQQMKWLELHKPNTWLVIPNQPIKASIVCSGIRKEITINETGTISIPPRCLIQTKQEIIRAKVFSEISMITTYSKPIKINMSSLEAIKVSSVIRTEEPIRLSKELQDIQNEETDLAQHLSTHHWRKVIIHTSIYSTFCVLLITLTIFGVAYIIIKNKTSDQRRQHDDTTPAMDFELQPIYATPGQGENVQHSR